MSLKLVELQVALPRTKDAGKLQEQVQQKGIITQENIQATTKQVDEKNRRKVTEAKEAQNNKVTKDTNGLNNGEILQSLKQQVKHPFKGTMLDIEG